jgi:hypothetical protein
VEGRALAFCRDRSRYIPIQPDSSHGFGRDGQPAWSIQGQTDLSFLILELYSLILRKSDSSGKQIRINFKVIPVANEWRAVGNGGEWIF